MKRIEDCMLFIIITLSFCKSISSSFNRLVLNRKNRIIIRKSNNTHATISRISNLYLINRFPSTLISVESAGRRSLSILNSLSFLASKVYPLGILTAFISFWSTFFVWISIACLARSLPMERYLVHPNGCCIIIWMDCNVFIFFQIFVKEYRNHTFLIVQNA